MNWNYVVTGLVEIAVLVGPAYLYHHKKIQAVVMAVEQIVEALAGPGQKGQ